MSTRGTTYFDDYDPMDWQPPPPKPWCKYCMVAHCGCPNEPTIDQQRAQHIDGMGCE